MFNTKKIIILILFTIFFVLNFSYASTNGVPGESTLFSFLETLKNILQGIWVVLAIIAGKLYTNDLLYGTSIYLDELLWHIWNFSKNIANFIIGFILIVSIFLLFVGKVKNILSIIGKLGIASILVNASWFIIAVLIDVSVILLAAVGGFPKSLLGGYDIGSLKEVTYCENIELGIKSSENPEDIINNIYNCPEGNKKTILNVYELLANMNDMTGPLFYIGASILNVDKKLNIDPKEVKNGKDATKTVSISSMLHLVILLLFTIPIFLLIIIGVVRIFWIWIYIAFSPLIFLDQIFGGKLASKQKAFAFKNMIGLIFQPVLVVFALGVSLIFLVSLQSVFISTTTNEPAKKALGICENNSMCVGKEKLLTIDGDFMNKIVKGTGGVFGYIIMTILSTILLWSMIKLSFKSTEITASISDSIYKFTEKGLMSVPIIPTPYGGVGIGAVELAFKRSQLTKGFKAQAASKADLLIDEINKFLGIRQIDLKISVRDERLDKINNSSSREGLMMVLKEFIQDTNKNNPDLIPQVSTNYQEVLSEIINSIGEKDPGIYKILGLNKNGNMIKDPKEMFEEEEFKQFVTGLIQKPDTLDDFKSDPITGFNKIKQNSMISLLSLPIKKIRENIK